MKTIVIDGVDGTGKQTQCIELNKNLKKLGFKVKLVSFPIYENDSSILLRKYLNGDYGTDPSKINPYAASILYSVDRLNYFLEEDLNNIDILLCDRYTTSNLIHQATKIEDTDQRIEFINWLNDFEYEKLKLPKPDKVFYLQLSPEISEKLREKRSKKTDVKDIHESDLNYLKRCNNLTEDIINNQGWEVINCNNNNSIKSVDEIQKELLSKVLKVLNNESD